MRWWDERKHPEMMQKFRSHQFGKRAFLQKRYGQSKGHKSQIMYLFRQSAAGKVHMMSCCRLIAFIYSHPLWVHEESTDSFWGGWQTEAGGLLHPALSKEMQRKAKDKAECGATAHAGGDGANVPCAPEGWVLIIKSHRLSDELSSRHESPTRHRPSQSHPTAWLPITICWHFTACSFCYKCVLRLLH